MTQEQFELLLDKVVIQLSNQSQSQTPCLSPKEFEDIVLSALKRECRSTKSNANRAFHQHAFPDFRVNGFGVEVKHTTKDTWLAVGNSIFEGMRDKNAKQIYLIYGKMGGWPEVRWARYADCVTHVRISHSPRFVIEMDKAASLFKTIGVPYSDFCQLSPEEKMIHIRSYVRKNLRDGEQLWWLEDREEQEHALPMVVKFFRTLPIEEKRKLRAEATLLCPEVVQGSRARGKYDRAGIYLITRHGVYASQLRDLFSAGSVGARSGQRGHKYIIAALQDIKQEIRSAAEYLDDELFVEYWGKVCAKEERIKYWLSLADQHAPDWTPSKSLFE